MKTAKRWMVKSNDHPDEGLLDFAKTSSQCFITSKFYEAWPLFLDFFLDRNDQSNRKKWRKLGYSIHEVTDSTPETVKVI